jgi:uncharacterized protein (DUF488 family)
MADHIFTFGYEGLTLDAFIARLKSARVKTVIDVRANPLSRKRGFSKGALSAALDAVGITYTHMPAMGCPKPVRERYKRDSNWAAYTRGFLRYLNEQRDALLRVVQIAKTSPSCLICFEADFERCHRTFVARGAAQLGGFQVAHITDRKVVPDAVARSAA